MSVSVDDRRIRKATYTEMEAEWLRRSLRRYTKAAWSQVEAHPFQSNWHLDAICDHLTYVTIGDIRNLMINIPPRQTKSLTVGVMWPTWWWTDEPEIQFMTSSYANDLALRDAVKSRDLIQSGWYQERYGGVYYLDPAQNQKSRYVNNHHGYRIATSVGGKTTGEGGDVLIIDDAHNMGDIRSDTKRNGVLNWYDNSWRSRLNDPKSGHKVAIGQRSHDMELYGHIQAGESDRWVILMLPNEYDPKRHCYIYLNPKGTKIDYESKYKAYQKGLKDLATAEERNNEDAMVEALECVEANEPVFEDPRTKKGELLNPGRFGPEETATEKAAMTQIDYQAQFNQDPEAGGGLIIKRKWWRQWVYPEGHPRAFERMPNPKFEILLASYDTAFKEGEENDYSARTLWGLFMLSETGRDEDASMNALLIETMNERLSFPDLKDNAVRFHKAWEPDHTIIEDKASGTSLVQELNEAGVDAWAVDPGGYDKTYRTHIVSSIPKSGRVWYITTTGNYEAIAQSAKFPLGEFDDIHDSSVNAWAFMRRMGDIDLPDDEKGNRLKLFQAPTRRAPYG